MGGSCLLTTIADALQAKYSCERNGPYLTPLRRKKLDLDTCLHFLHHSEPGSGSEDTVFRVRWFALFMNRTILSALLTVFPTAGIHAGGGMVLEDDVCIIRIDFYSAHFTAYQLDTSGNEQFCQNLPNVGKTIFVLDYLHPSLKLVPVDFRIIRNVTGQGRYVKLKHVEQLKDLEQLTVFYQPPVVRENASLKIEYEFKEEGAYVGIVSAGHPSNDTIYTAVFPFEVGGPNRVTLYSLSFLVFGLAAFFLIRSRRSAQAMSRRGATN